MTLNRPQKVSVLLVEDNEGDIGLFREGLNAIRASLNLNVVTDGIQALEFLRTNPRPNLIVLDLNIPGKSGYEVLEELKQDSRLNLKTAVAYPL